MSDVIEFVKGGVVRQSSIPLSKLLESYVSKNGWVLVSIPRGRKSPVTAGWNRRESCIATPELALGLTGNVGIAHAWSDPPTAALDIDRLDDARAHFRQHGIDLEALLGAPNSVGISSGRPNRAKLLYTLPEPLSSLKLADGAIELRCATRDGLTVQDLLPPSLHPGGQHYRWIVGSETIGTKPPPMPEELLAFWRSKLPTVAQSSPSSTAPSSDAAALRELIANRDPDASYDEWLRVGMALHYETRGSDSGLAVWNEWSSRGTKYKNRDDLAVRWRSFRLDVANPVTIASLRRESVARAEDFTPVAANGEHPLPDVVSIDDFYAYLPQHQYLFVPTRELWPASSVNSRIRGPSGMKASEWLDRNRSVEQMTWMPGAPMVIPGRVVSDGGWIEKPGCSVFNLYRPPLPLEGDASQVGPWLDHLYRVYPDNTDHIIKFLAHRVQRPGEKINHAIVLGGNQGIGKDTIFEPVKHAVGAWNFAEVSPPQLLGRFNGFVKSVILRVSEARDLGDVDRYSFYERMKTFTAAPPDVHRCDEKNLREHSVMNVCGVVITSNHKTNGIYLPVDDRRHYVAWSDARKEDFPEAYWRNLYAWYHAGGYGHVAAYLACLDLSAFDSKAPPPKTTAFYDIVDANRAPEDAELADALDALGNPAAVTVSQLASVASGSFATWLQMPASRRQIPHRFEAAGYVPVRNDADRRDGHWKVDGKRQVIYARKEFSLRDRIAAAIALVTAVQTWPPPHAR